MARTKTNIYIYIRCIHGVFGRETTKHTVIYGAYIRLWPDLEMESKGVHPHAKKHISTHARMCVGI